MPRKNKPTHPVKEAEIILAACSTYLDELTLPQTFTDDLRDELHEQVSDALASLQDWLVKHPV